METTETIPRWVLSLLQREVVVVAETIFQDKTAAVAAVDRMTAEEPRSAAQAPKVITAAVTLASQQRIFLPVVAVVRAVAVPLHRQVATVRQYPVLAVSGSVIQ